MASMEHEERLTGGNVNEVVRAGDTVRRLPGTNELVPALLRYLEERGFDGVPRYLGRDEQGRDILTYIAGDVAGDSYPDTEPYLWTDEALAGMAGLLRRYHDATAGLAATLPVRSDGPLPGWANEAVCHNDAAPYNTVFRNHQPLAFIDFDMAAPGPRIWDIAYTAYTAVPLAGFAYDMSFGKTVPYETALHVANRRRRLALFFRAYGMERPDGFPEAVTRRIRALCGTLATEAAKENPAFVKMVEEGHLAHYERELVFLEDHFSQWL